MLRKLLLAGIACLTLVSPMAFPTVSEAHEPYRPHHHHYRVYYRDCYHEPWRVYGSYHHYDEARHAARHLRARGLEAHVR